MKRFKQLEIDKKFDTPALKNGNRRNARQVCIATPQVINRIETYSLDNSMQMVTRNRPKEEVQFEKNAARFFGSSSRKANPTYQSSIPLGTQNTSESKLVYNPTFKKSAVSGI